MVFNIEGVKMNIKYNRYNFVKNSQMFKDSQMMKGETMFEYLKRNKKNMLEQTLNRNKPFRDSFKDKSQNDSLLSCEKTQRDSHKQNNFKQTARLNKNCSNDSSTPRRTTIIEVERKHQTRSFLQMISPIRSKSPAQKQIDRSVKKQNIPSKKESFKESFTKKMLGEKINLMRDIIESYIKSGKNLKQKAHLLFVDLKPFFRHLQNCEESGFQRKTQEVKGKIKAIETIFRDFNTQTSQNSIDQFYIYFSQHLNELEGNAIAQIQENRNSFTNEILSAKNMEIIELKQKNIKLQRQILKLNKQIEKLERGFENLSTQSQCDKQQYFKNFKEKIAKLEIQLSKVQQINQMFQQQNEMLKDQIAKLQNDKKLIAFERQKYEEEYLNTITKVKSQQQQFLLNQIMILKKQFNADITKMSELHQIKQQGYINSIKSQSFEVSKLKDSLDMLCKENHELQQSIATIKAQNARFKKQNQCLASDMHRINEELYQHWLALKDIKTLSQRLDIFYKFKKIYEQLIFNQHLFL